jgi:hypothetical protein
MYNIVVLILKKNRKHNKIKAKAESTVKNILDLSTGSSDVDSSESTNNSSVDSDESCKKLKNESLRVKRNQLFLTIRLMKLLKNKCGLNLSYSLNMQAQK